MSEARLRQQIAAFLRRQEARDQRWGRTLGQLYRKIEVMEAHCADCQRRIQETHLVLDGSPENGKRPGLRTRVAELESSRRWMRCVLRGVGVVVSAILLAELFGVLGF